MNVLRRRIHFGLEDMSFWHWVVFAPDDEYAWFSFLPRQVGLVGSLPNNRRLTKPFPVSLTHDNGEWLASDPVYSMHAVGPRIHEAVAKFRHILSDYLDILSEHQGPMSQHLRDQLAYLQEMIEETQA